MMPDESKTLKSIENLILPLLSENTQKLTRIETVLLGIPGSDDRGLVGAMKRIGGAVESLERVVASHESHLQVINQRCESLHNPGSKHRWGLWTLGSGIGAGIAGIAWAIWERLK